MPKYNLHDPKGRVKGSQEDIDNDPREFAYKATYDGGFSTIERIPKGQVMHWPGNGLVEFFWTFTDAKRWIKAEISNNIESLREAKKFISRLTKADVDKGPLQ